jgi:hypothetical protein
MKRLLLLLALASSSSTPEFEHSSPAGVERADDRDDARMLAMMANLFAHDVCAKLGVELAPQFVIEHLSGTDVQRDSADRIISRRIVIGDVPLRAQARFSVAHEFIHWYASAPWDRLPHAIEDGLADYFALQIAPEFRNVRVAELEQRLVEMTPARRAAALGVNERE